MALDAVVLVAGVSQDAGGRHRGVSRSRLPCRVVLLVHRDPVLGQAGARDSALSQTRRRAARMPELLLQDADVDGVSLRSGGSDDVPGRGPFGGACIHIRAGGLEPVIAGTVGPEVD